jgi:hypothetical protein
MALIESFGPSLPLVLMVLGVLLFSLVVAVVAMLADY